MKAPVLAFAVLPLLTCKSAPQEAPQRPPEVTEITDPGLKKTAEVVKAALAALNHVANNACDPNILMMQMPTPTEKGAHLELIDLAQCDHGGQDSSKTVTGGNLVAEVRNDYELTVNLETRSLDLDLGLFCFSLIQQTPGDAAGGDRLNGPTLSSSTEKFSVPLDPAGLNHIMELIKEAARKNNYCECLDSPRHNPAVESGIPSLTMRSAFQYGEYSTCTSSKTTP